MDELWFLVSPQNPLKPASGLLDDDIRLHLARLAVGRKRGLHVSDFEFHLPRPSYMVHTLEALRAAYPDREFVLVIGADNWYDFPRWHQPEEILRHHRLLIYPRPGYPLPLPPRGNEESGDRLNVNTPERPRQTSSAEDGISEKGLSLVPSPLLPISSTQIRHSIATDPTYSGEGLSPRVWKEIQRHRYYFPD